MREDVLGMFWVEAIGIVATGGVIGGLMGALSAAATEGNVIEGMIEGVLTGTAGAIMGLSGARFIAGTIVGGMIDIGVQLTSQALSNQNPSLKNVDYGRALKTGIQTGIGVKVPAFGKGTENVVNAIGTSTVWAETTVLIVSADIIYTNTVGVKKSNTITITQSYAYTNTGRTGKMMR